VSLSDKVAILADHLMFSVTKTVGHNLSA